MNAIVRVYANLVIHGAKTIDEVPAFLRQSVQQILDSMVE